jgi:hypothetical protein
MERSNEQRILEAQLSAARLMYELGRMPVEEVLRRQELVYVYKENHGQSN